MSEVQYRCGMEAALDLVGGKWKILILYHLCGATRRFGELRRLVGSISEKMLSQQLKEMVADGLLRRIDYRTVPPYVEYETTMFGADLCVTMQPICQWGDRHMAAIGAIAASRADRSNSA